MTASRTQRRAFNELTMTVFALPSHPCSWLPPYASDLQQLALNLGLTVGFNIARIAVRPLAEFGRLPRAFRTTDVTTPLADGGSRRNEERLALVAGASNALLRDLVDSFFAILGGDSQQLLLFLRRLVSLLLLAFLARRSLFGIARTLLAALVLALGAHFVGSISGSTVMAGAVHTHADRPLDTLHTDGLSRSSDPFVRLEGQSILGKEGAGAFLLESGAVELLGDGSGSSRSRSWGWSRGSGGGGTIYTYVVSRGMLRVCCSGTYAAGATSFFSTAGVAAAGVPEADGTLLLDFSLLNTLLIRFTYLPKLRRRSAPSKPADVGSLGLDMVLAMVLAMARF